VSSSSTVTIATDTDIVSARQKGRALAEELGFTGTDLALIATAISEIARNIVQHGGGRGEIGLSECTDGSRRGIQIVARDEGPGIADTELALRDGYSTARSLGLGLPGAKRLMDQFDLQSEVGKGTTIVMRRWSLRT
jgi:serine/threonine-protein kinase RsbT